MDHYGIPFSGYGLTMKPQNGASSTEHPLEHITATMWNLKSKTIRQKFECGTMCKVFAIYKRGNGTFTSSPNNTWNTSFYLTVLTNRVPGNSTTSLLLCRRKWISNDTHLLLLLQLWRNFCLTLYILHAGNQLNCKLH